MTKNEAAIMQDKQSRNRKIAYPTLRLLCVLFLLSVPLFAEDNIVEYRKYFVPMDMRSSLSVEPSLPVPRERFEQLVKQFEQRTEEQRVEHPHLSKIVLHAALDGRQLTDGQGTFTLHPRSDGSQSIPLNPLTLAVHSLEWEGGEEAVFFHEPESGNRLLVPSATDTHSYEQLHFHWSLQSRRDTRNGTVFDLALPPCMSIELHIDLPESLTLTASDGLVVPSADVRSASGAVNDSFRTWRVLLGHHSNTTLTIVEDKTLPSVKPKSAIHQSLTYAIRPQGLETVTRITFDRIDARPNELVFELEMPLRPVEVRYGDQPITSWTRSAISPDITEVRVDLSAFSGEEPHELSIEAWGPLREDQRWVLPRVRVTSSDVFWVETRCAVNVYSPLRARNILFHRAVQVPHLARAIVDWAVRELYVFQFFQDDAQIELEVVYSIPTIMVNSAVQVDFGDLDIRGTVYLECSVTEGERFTLNFPLSEHWTVDSVTSYAPGILPGETDPVFSWDILEGEPQTLSVQLESPLNTRRRVMLQLSCRYSNSSQSQFRLAELFPIQLAHRRVESHHIAVRQNLTMYSLKSSMSAQTFNVSPDSTRFSGDTSVPLFGGTYPFDSRTQDILFELERTRSSYTAEIFGNISIESDGLIPTFRIRCSSITPSVSRIFVHFTPFGEENLTETWDWKLTGAPEGARPIRTQKISQEELKSMFTVSEQQNWNADLYRGEIWEIRFEELQFAPFEISAVSLIPLADSMPIPLATVPLAATQRGELTIVSPQHFDYRIVGGQHNSIPTAPPAWDRYQHIRAAFRYDPLEELRRAQHTPLLLQRLTPEEQFDTAWVWSMRLDSQYDSEGVVRNKALFLVENQGRGALQITLPRGIDAANVSAVWRDSQQIPWHYEAEQGTIAVALPAGQRFVSIALEYTYQDLPLVQQRKLRPHYPSVDVPILSGSWISWFPPEFDVSLRRTTLGAVQEPTSPIKISKALDYLLSDTLRSFLWSEWDNALNGKQRRAEVETAAQHFFEEVVKVLQTNSISTWGELIGNERVLSAVRPKLADTRRDAHTRLLIDKQALTFLGISPSTRIDNIASITNDNVRETLFERTGLVLLIAPRTRQDGIREYVFALTAPTTLSLYRQFQSAPSGHCVRIVPFDFFESVSPSSTEWIPATRWMEETTLSAIPWAVSAQMMQGTALTSDWNAYELPIDAEQSLYIVHRQKFAALQWLAFLAVVLITCRKPFSSPLFLFVLLIVFELTARSVAPCYIGIPSAALLGVLVSFAFILIRSQHVPKEPPPPPPPDNSTEWSVSFVPTHLATRSVLLCALLLGLCASAAAQAIPEPIQEAPRKEPYRVFYPIDDEGQPVGDDVWVPLEFSLLLHNAQFDNTAVSQRWHITKAVYQGSLIRGASGLLECADDFKVVYDIYLESSNATITLPNLPVVPGRYLWNSQQIQPILQDESASETLTFLIENETPGRHTLEVGLSAKSVLRNSDATYMVAFAVPKVPQSILRLNIPPDTPLVNVPDALGAVTINTALAPVLTAELGAAEQLSFSWGEGPNQGGTLVSEVEQFFWIRVKPSQIELETLFRYRIDGGTIQTLTIQTDPRWIPSGRFRCDEHTIIPTEIQSFDSPYNVTQIAFQSPVSGTITLRADFVLQDLTGAGSPFGNLRLPEFTALRSQPVKSMLGVSADPSLELDMPIEGRDSGFEAGWHGTSAVIPPLFVNTPFWEIAELAGEIFARRDDAAGERPDAAYDLTQTEPDWTLNIRARKTVPDVSVSQSVQFDAHESRIHIVGEFTSAAPVFRQHFSTDRPIQIEPIEVRDSRDVVIESRLQQIAPETNPHQYVVFFKNPVAGKYTVTIRGFFESDTREESMLQSVPLLTFEDAQTTEHSLNMFRTPAVIAAISSEQSGWAKLSTVPTAPDSFAPSRPLGTWQKAEDQNESLQFALSLNHPRVMGKTVLSFLEEGEQLTMALDFTGTITGGELRSLTFQWDERCGIIQSVVPAASWFIDTAGAQRTLTLSPAEPMQGEQQFRMVVSLTPTGTTFALPNVFPIAQNMDTLESEIFVDLPVRRGNEMIPWDLNMLEAAEEQVADDSRMLYRAVNTDFSASVSQVESRLTALFYDIDFLIYRDGSMIGIVTVDLRNRGQDSFVLQMPPGYEPIQIFAAGSVLDRTRLEGEQRWRINIGISDYPQRLNILFRASLPQSLRRWSREEVASTLQFPVLEGVMVRDTIWTIAFEGDMPPLNVVSVLEQRREYDFRERLPLSGRDAALTLIGINLVREHNLLRVLDSIPVSTRQEEMRRWFLHWSEEWDTVADKVDFQAAHLPLSLQNVRSNFILRPLDSGVPRGESSGSVRPFLETMSAGTREALRLSKDQSVGDLFGVLPSVQVRQPVPILNSQVYWQGRISGEMRHLFGAEEGAVRAIRLTSLPPEIDWSDWLSEHTWLWISLGLLVPIFVLLSVRWVYLNELWLQFPHFWGMSIGVLLWTFLPESFIGVAIIILTFVSFFRPSWIRHRSAAKPF